MTTPVVKGYTAKKHTFFIPAGTKKLPRTLIDRTDQPECSIPTADLIEYVKTLLSNVLVNGGLARSESISRREP